MALEEISTHGKLECFTLEMFYDGGDISSWKDFRLRVQTDWKGAYDLMKTRFPAGTSSPVVYIEWFVWKRRMPPRLMCELWGVVIFLAVGESGRQSKAFFLECPGVLVH